MKSKKPLVGFDRYVEKAWMDKAASLVVGGNNLNDINEQLDQYLLPSITGETSRRKTKNVLTATWAKSLVEESAYKKEAVALFACANSQERLAIHYGMSIATYPFFMSLSKILGRLFKLQDEVSNTEFYRRVIETVGDRESIKRAAARYLQSLIEWGVLEQPAKAAVKPAAKIQVSDSTVITWLYAAILFSSDRDRLSIDDIVSDPCWFPFRMPHGCFNVSESEVVEVVHQGIGNTLIALKV
ncbi:MAG: hypothetical protein DRR42_13325 [Gammaproteobacteria bacterium]|nr:MAG: hypothetical protein DRR42_13325 [Gammaproteobacteria bacterium]